jgi:hypothetical protein
LRQAALILTGGWSKNADARDDADCRSDADRIVPLWAELLRRAALADKFELFENDAVARIYRAMRKAAAP